MALSLALALDSNGCDDTATPDAVQTAQQRELSAQSNQQVGMPGITNFTEKKIVRKLYELRDQQIATYAYTQDINGHLHFICNSLGYGLPYGVQFTPSERPAKNGETQMSGNLALPQAEPNGLFMPPTAEGTWVICGDKNHPDNIAPVYVEPRVIVSPFKLNAVDSLQ